jgi:hypothetical protein
MQSTVIETIMNLKDASLERLQTVYAELFPSATTPPNNKVFLWRKIAYKLQEKAYGGLSEGAQSRITTLISQYDPINNKALRPTDTAPIKGQKIKKRDMRLPIPGTVITKEYKGQTIEVRVLEKGFEYKGAVYKTLTAIAKTITGAHWNGFLFFNL